MSYGEPVQQRLSGVRVQMLTTTMPMVIKLPLRHGWAEGPLPGSISMHEIKHVPTLAISELQPREDQSASFLLQNQFKLQLLQASGQNGAFIKQKKVMSLQSLNCYGWMKEVLWNKL